MPSPFLSLLTDLLAIPSPSKNETRMAAHIASLLSSWGYAAHTTTDERHNVLVHLGPRDASHPPLCLSAHIDEIGFEVTAVEPDGTLRLKNIGGLFPWKFGEGPLTILGEHRDIPGTLSFGSPHADGPLFTTLQHNDWSQALVHTGLTPDELATAGVRPGTAATPHASARGPLLLGPPADPLVACWTLDNRGSVVALLLALKTLADRGLTPTRPVLVAFTAREEIDCAGLAHILAQHRPSAVIAIDGVPTSPAQNSTLDGTPALRLADGFATYDEALSQHVLRAASAAGHALRPVRYQRGATEASFAKQRLGFTRVASFGHPRDSTHGFEVARLSAFEAVAQIAVELLTTRSAERPGHAD